MYTYPLYTGYRYILIIDVSLSLSSAPSLPFPPSFSFSLPFLAPSLQLGSTCSDTNFPITNHSVVVTQLSLSGSGREEVGRTSFTEDQTMTTPAIISIPALMQDRDYRIFVQACINITCRDTRSIPLSKYSTVSLYHVLDT